MNNNLYLWMLVALLLGFGAVHAQTRGGPDVYGYTWKTQADTSADAPSYNWIDITTRGTQVTGLGDDNVVGPFSMGWPFQYYWQRFSRFYVGSNGYISFDNNNVSSIAIGFPSMPTADGKDNLIAPLLSDLNFAGTNNPGEVYYWSNSVDTVIVSFETVPFWNSGSNFAGSNSFQIILSGADSSITFQYKTQSGSYDAAYNNRLNPVVVGIENMTGTIGLQVANSLPSTSRSVKFYYPDSVAFQVQDAEPAQLANEQNGGFFIAAGRTVDFDVTIENSGNVTIGTPTIIDGKIIDPLGTTVYQAVDTISQIFLNQPIQLTLGNGFTPTRPGHYTLQATTANPNDINSANDVLEVEMVVIDTAQRAYSLSYWNGGNYQPGNTTSWTGGGDDEGVGVYMVPPTHPVELTEVEMYIASFTGTGTAGFDIKIFADDAPAGEGTLLDSIRVPASATTSNAWNKVTLPQSIRIDSGGFYVAWYMSGINVSLGVDPDAPYSLRSYEVLGNIWADYRFADTQDPMILVSMEKICTADIDLGQDTLVCSNQPFQLDAGPFKRMVMWSDSSMGRFLTISQSGTYAVAVEDSAFCPGADTIDVTILPQPSVSLGPDVVFCDGDSAVLDAGTGFSSYQWNTLANTQSIVVRNSGSFVVTVTNTDGCAASDTVEVVANPLPNIDLGPAQSGCAGDEIILNAGLGFQSYLWNTGSRMRTITVRQNGTYSVSVVDQNGCENSDSVDVNFAATGLELGADTSICEGSSFTLDAGPGFDAYIWSDGSQNQTLTVSQGGTYVVTIVDGTCQAEDTIVVDELPLPVPSFRFFNPLGPNRFVFQNTSTQALSYSWDFGDGNTSVQSNPQHEYTSSGNFVICLTATNDCGSTDFCDTVEVLIEPDAIGELLPEGALRVYPNPASSSLTVDFTRADLRKLRIDLLDTRGRVLRSISQQQLTPGQPIELSIGDLAAGPYLLRVQTARYRASRMVVKE